MKIFLKRATGFYGMGSPLKILVNSQSSGYLLHQQSRQIEVQNEATLQIQFYCLRSEKLQLTALDAEKTFVVKQNIQIIQLYALFFLAILGLTAVTMPSLFLPAGALIGYFIFLVKHLNKFYVIEVEEDGRSS